VARASRTSSCAAGESKTLATNLSTLVYTGLCGDSTLEGNNRPALRRAASLVIFVIGATTGAFLTRYGVLWPVLAAFTLFVVALPILLPSRDTQ
jgi:uncharacterized membrane protein YoaK (UPF0700 family)